MLGKTISHYRIIQRTDIWPLGVVLYEMLTGLCPFRSEYDQALRWLERACVGLEA